MSECVICGAEVSLDDSTVQGELIECKECGTQLEVTSLQPPKLAEAPMEDEDWGQ